MRFTKAERVQAQAAYDDLDDDDISTERLLQMVADRLSEQWGRDVDSSDVVDAIAIPAKPGGVK